ncbi:hypothetical protein AAG906_021708 [Vitis piasezkii]
MVLVKLLPQQFKSLRRTLPILGKVGKVSNRVELPPRLKVHLVFHVEHILTDRVIRRRGVPPATEYLVKWKGLPESEANWEPADALWQFQEQIERWGRVSQDDSNEPPGSLETPRVGRVLKVLEMPRNPHKSTLWWKT